MKEGTIVFRTERPPIGRVLDAYAIVIDVVIYRLGYLRNVVGSWTGAEHRAERVVVATRVLEVELGGIGPVRIGRVANVQVRDAIEQGHRRRICDLVYPGADILSRWLTSSRRRRMRAQAEVAAVLTKRDRADVVAKIVRHIEVLNLD